MRKVLLKVVMAIAICVGLTTSTNGILNIDISSIHTVSAVDRNRWHKGMPKKLLGKWHGNGMTLIVSNKHVYFVPDSGASVSKVKKLVSKKVGPSVYKYKITWAEGSNYIGTLKLVNSNLLKYNGYYLSRQ